MSVGVFCTGTTVEVKIDNIYRRARSGILIVQFLCKDKDGQCCLSFFQNDELVYLDIVSKIYFSVDSNPLSHIWCHWFDTVAKAHK